MLLYKYRSLDEKSAEYTHRIITDREAYFSKTSAFNDPFEFRPRLTLEATKAEFAAYLDALYQRKFPLLNRQQRKESISAILRDKTRNHKSAEAMQTLRNGLDEINQFCGVLCLSGDPSNILMWSHYSDCHAGVCFGFDATSTNSFFSKAQKVIYQENYPTANLIKDHPSAYQDKIILTKAKFWEYEQEWRIVEHKKGSGAQKFNNEDLKQVIFGVKTSMAAQEKILELLERSKIQPNIYKAKLHEDRYAVVLEQLKI
jgi:Protein of unknown function (DUF2971)